MKYDLLTSIKPYYAYLIMKGDKTVEVRKFNIKDPNWSRKFKVYVSKDKQSLKRIPEADRAEFEKYIGKVAFEFVRDKVYQYTTLSGSKNECDVSDEDMERLSCLSHKELSHYEHFSSSHTYGVFGITITALKIYDKPKELGEFYCYNKELEKRFIDGDDFCCYDATNEYGEAITECDGENIHNCYRCWEEWSGWCHRITRPPQSYMRIEEV